MRTSRARLTVTWLLPGALVACDRDDLYSRQSFNDVVREAYAECSESEVRFLTGKHALQTAFAACGSNNFTQFSWSPDGVHLYFQLPLAAHILNGETKTIQSLPLEQPIGNGTWLSEDLVALPLGPEEGQSQDRLVLYNRAQNTLTSLPVPQDGPRELQPTGRRDAVYYLAPDGAGTVRAWVADFTKLEVAPAFPWLPSAPDTFTVTPEQDWVAVGQGATVTVYRGATGEVLHTFPDATRGVVHPDGRYVALETLGAPISPFDQRSWDELSPEARERELRRQKEWLERQPKWLPREVRPPTLDIVDLTSGKRFRIEAFYGERFQWYPSPYHASFVLWGMEGKELNKNVALTNIAERMRMAVAGQLPLGFTAWAPPEGTVPASPVPASPVPASPEPASPEPAGGP